MYSTRRVIMYNCHLAWWSGAIQRMLFSNIHWKVLYPAEQEEAWNFKTSFKRRQWHLLLWINWGMIEKARQDLETNIRSSDKSEWTIEAKWVTGKYIPRGERDVIRLRNPTEDWRAFRRMLTSADRDVMVTMLLIKNKSISLPHSHVVTNQESVRACLHKGGGPQVGEVTRLGGVTRLSI